MGPKREERIVSRFPSPSQEVALELVKQALLVREPDRVTKFFRLGTTGADKVVAFLTTMAERDGEIQSMDWLSSMDANGLLIDGVAVNTQLGDKRMNRLALLTPDEAGFWKIDFESFARIVEPSWSDLLEKNAPVAMVRVVVGQDFYYNGFFLDDTQWRCFGIVSPERSEVMLGYCRKGSRQDAAMQSIMTNAGRSVDGSPIVRATLEIQRRDGAELRQFEITRVLAEDWIMAAKPFDENFK
ncbi:MAG: hypothetical protein H8M99_08845 [Gloeobacteraceae cyanobacterium ES-bin-144]|nr:hypothetical protein [Verrucomicrobiales bacterium]